MTCFAVFKNNKQIRVFHYSLFEINDMSRAYDLALKLGKGLGYGASVEHFHICDVGKTVWRYS